MKWMRRSRGKISAFIVGYYSQSREDLQAYNRSKALPSNEFRIVRYVLCEKLGLDLEKVDPELDVVIKEFKNSGGWPLYEHRHDPTARAPFPKHPTIETFVLALFGLIVLAITPRASVALLTAGLLSLTGCFYLSQEHSNVALSGRWKFILFRWVTVFTILMLEYFVVMRYALLVPSVFEIDTYSRHLQMFMLALVMGFGFGLAYFLGTRLYLFLYSILINGFIHTLRMIPYVWTSRCFSRSVFDSLELVPGYPLPRSNRKFENESIYVFLFHLGAKTVILLSAFISSVVFKMSLIFMWPVVYLSQSLRITSEAGKEYIISNYRSRTAEIGVWLGVVCDFSKCVQNYLSSK